MTPRASSSFRLCNPVVCTLDANIASCSELIFPRIDASDLAVAFFLSIERIAFLRLSSFLRGAEMVIFVLSIVNPRYSII